jgi:hypothetical protein
MNSAAASLSAERIKDAAPMTRADTIIVGLLAFVVTICIGLAWLAADNIKQKSNPAPFTATFQIGQKAITVPGEWLRETMPTKGGVVVSLDLLVSFDEFVLGQAAMPQSSKIFISVSSADQSLDPAERVRLLYARFLTHEVKSTENGLIRRAFKTGTAFENEELVFAAPDGKAFAARCMAAQASGFLRDTCLSEMRVNGLDVQFRFDPKLLNDWEALTRAIQREFGGEPEKS